MKRNDGTEGYVASSYLNYSASTPTTPTTPVGSIDVSKFADYKADQYWAEDFQWAVKKRTYQRLSKRIQPCNKEIRKLTETKHEFKSDVICTFPLL